MCGSGSAPHLFGIIRKLSKRILRKMLEKDTYFDIGGAVSGARETFSKVCGKAILDDAGYAIMKYQLEVC